MASKFMFRWNPWNCWNPLLHFRFYPPLDSFLSRKVTLTVTSWAPTRAVAAVAAALTDAVWSRVLGIKVFRGRCLRCVVSEVKALTDSETLTRWICWMYSHCVKKKVHFGEKCRQRSAEIIPSIAGPSHIVSHQAEREAFFKLYSIATLREVRWENCGRI